MTYKFQGTINTADVSYFAKNVRPCRKRLLETVHECAEHGATLLLETRDAFSYETVLLDEYAMFGELLHWTKL